MNYFRMLKEVEELNSFRDKIQNNFEAIFDEIDEYILIGEDKDTILDSLRDNLNAVILEFEKLGKIYEPDSPTDVSEKTFKSILNRYKNSSKLALENLTDDILEEFNTQTRYILNLIEIHRTDYMDEGEVLYEE